MRHYGWKIQEGKSLRMDITRKQKRIRVVVARAGAACARPMKGRVWPSLPANASVKKDSCSTGASIDRAHLKNPKNYCIYLVH